MTVIAALENAFADNASEATCVDADCHEDRRFATIVIVFAAASAIPERTAATTPGGQATTKKRAKTDRNALYMQALGSTVLATVKEAFAVAPSLDDIRVLVLRRDPNAATPTDYLAAIYSAAFERSRTESLDWRSINPAEQLLSADEAVLQRKGVAGDIAAITVEDPETAQLIDTFAQALSAQS